MEITVSQAQGKAPVTVLHLKGAVTEEEQLEARAQEAYAGGARNFLIDLSEVPYMSSSGLRALHALYMMVRGEGAGESEGIRRGTYTSPHLKLLKPNKDVLEVLKTAGYDMFLEIYKDEKTALSSF
jgi:anti-anti-sigma factor